MIADDRTFVIAEAGVNHNGSIDIARRLVEEAGRAGADCVKFQSFSADRLVSRRAGKAPYQLRSAADAETQYDMLKALELSEDDHRALMDICRDNGVQFLSSPFDEQSADMLDRLGVPAFKVPSGELTNHGFLRYLAAKGRPMILSTGMSTLAEVADAVDAIMSTGARELSLLHCVSEYPAPFAEINLRAMRTMADAFGLPVGYSDHAPGIEVAVAAVALGARIIEKHMTLARDMEGPDHAASLEPGDLAEMVRAIRNVEAALGDGIKAPAPCEASNIGVARKSLVAERDIAAGERLGPGNVAVKRPGHGIQPADLEKVMGLTVTADIRAGSFITWKDLQ